MTQASSVIDSFVVPLVELLPVFNKAIPEIKEAEFLSLLTTAFERLSNLLIDIDMALKPDLVSTFLTPVFESTLSMITTDFNSFPEIRVNFFSLLKSIVKYNFQQLYNMPEDKFHTIMNCIVWSIKHELSTFSDLGLDLLYDTL
jgi:exportin-1